MGRFVVAFFKGGDLFRDIVFSDLEVFGAKAGDVVSLAVSDGNVELHQNDVDAETRCLVLRGGPGRSGHKKKQTCADFEKAGDGGRKF